MTAILLALRPGAAHTLPPEVELAAIAVQHRVAQARALLTRIAPWLVRGLVGTAVIAFLGLAVGPHVFGYRTMTMLTASMAPEIEPGDVTIVTPLAVKDVTEDMIITYHIPVDDHRVVSHRVVAVEHGPDGSVTVQTKGDANEAADPWRATLKGDTAWQVQAVVPEIGHVIKALRTPVVSQVLLYGAPALLAGWLLLAIWRPAPRDEQGEPGTDTTPDEEATA